MNIIKKLSDLADEFDKNGLYKEADIIDEIIKISVETTGVGIWPPPGEIMFGEPEIGDKGTAGKGEMKNPNVERWQKDYNGMLAQLKNKYGKDPDKLFPGLNWLEEDGIKGKNTITAMDLVRPHGSIESFKQAVFRYLDSDIKNEDTSGFPSTVQQWEKLISEKESFPSTVQQWEELMKDKDIFG